MINGLSNFLSFNDFNTDSESEKIMNSLFLDSEMRSRAMLIAQASSLNIEVSFGRFKKKKFSLYVLWHILLFSPI